MAFKYIALFALVAVALVNAAPYQVHGGHDDGGYGGGHGSGSGGSSHQTVHITSHDDGGHGGDDGGHGHGGHGHGGHGHDDQSSSHAEYTFDYGVTDKKTGDIKGHTESRKGHQVSGQYELIDADGHKRTVVYTADKHKGFQATVHREPTGIKVAGGGGSGHSFVGGHAAVSEYGHGSGAGADGGHGDDGHGYGHGHGYGGGHGGHGGSSQHGFSIVQEHAAAVGGHGGHGGSGSYGHDDHGHY